MREIKGFDSGFPKGNIERQEKLLSVIVKVTHRLLINKMLCL